MYYGVGAAAFTVLLVTFWMATNDGQRIGSGGSSTGSTSVSLSEVLTFPLLVRD